MSNPWHMLSDEEQAFASMLERYAAEELEPRAAETDETATFVRPQLRGLAELGLLGANLPEEDGGPGISAPALLRAVQIVAGACGSTVSALTAHYLATDSILLGGTADQRAKWLPRAATG
jgi:alkylation response protein AidB-like acyl-CoA dehydrogenase